MNCCLHWSVHCQHWLREEVSSPSSYPLQSSDPHHPPISPLSLEAAVRASAEHRYRWQCLWWEKAATKPDRHAVCSRHGPSTLHPVTSRLLDLYLECVDSGGWARVLYDVSGGIEKLTILCKIPPLPPPTVADPPSCKPGRPASEGHARD
jgi:hypothetical protein